MSEFLNKFCNTLRHFFPTFAEAWQSAKPRMPLLLLGLLAGMFISITLVEYYVVQRSYRLFMKNTLRPVDEKELVATISALQENSQRAMTLLTLLQDEIHNRLRKILEIRAILHEKQQERSLLELTEDQRRAVEALVRRSPSPREIFKSLDFWLGRVMPSAVFFVLGIIVTVIIRRSSPTKA